MPSIQNQRKAHRFFRRFFKSQHSFTRSEIRQQTGWTESSIRTYWGKQFKPFVVTTDSGVRSRSWRTQKYRVSEAFRPYLTWQRFRQHVTQVRRVSSDYRHHEYKQVLIYEFYMPLANEAALRTTLDALFFRDTIETRL